MLSRSLFVHLYKAMHENIGGISLLKADDYETVLRVLLSFSLEISSGHEIDSEPNNLHDMGQ